MKLICIGRNYGEHIAELGNSMPEDPVVFLKPETALLREGQDFIIPEHLGEIHWEVELVFRIGKTGKFIEPQFAERYISHYTVGIDFTARTLQQQLKEKGLPWERAKAFDGSAVCGKLLPFENLDSLMNLPFSLTCNDKIVQEGTMAQMIYPVPALISFVSKHFTLKTGDLLYTGTPKGVAKVSREDKLSGKLGTDNLFSLTVK